MQCRSGCGACCIAPSISSAIPGMPNGKAAGEACVHLMEDYRCAIFNDPARPKVCAEFMPDKDICGASRDEALDIISIIENETAFSQSSPSRKSI